LKYGSKEILWNKERNKKVMSHWGTLPSEWTLSQVYTGRVRFPTDLTTFCLTFVFTFKISSMDPKKFCGIKKEI
jgi:hypothetical protein